MNLHLTHLQQNYQLFPIPHMGAEALNTYRLVAFSKWPTRMEMWTDLYSTKLVEQAINRGVSPIPRSVPVSSPQPITTTVYST